MGRQTRYPKEFQERAVRLVYEWRDARDRTDGGFREVAEQLGVHLEAVRNWVNQAEIDAAGRPGLTTDEKQRIRELERENFELRRANWSPENQETKRWLVPNPGRLKSTFPTEVFPTIPPLET